MQSLLPAETISLDPWDQLPNEGDKDYDCFMCYLQLGPGRTIIEAYREYLVQGGKILPGEPTPKVPSSWGYSSRSKAWAKRAKAYDEHNWAVIKATVDDTMRDKVKAMVKEHIEGAQIFRKAAVNGMFVKDNDGNVILDPETGEPELVDIIDPGLAMRLFRQSVAIERTSSNLPAEIIAMSTSKIEERILTLRQELGVIGELEGSEEQDEEQNIQAGEVLDGEFEEVEGERADIDS